MRFFAFKSDIEMKPAAPTRRRSFSVDASTSVIQHKRHFFETLKTIGTLIPMDEGISHKDAEKLLGQPDAIFAQMHNVVHLTHWDRIPKRRFCHSLGDFMLPEVFFEPVNFDFNNVNLVTSDVQEKRLKKHLGLAAPATAVFTPRLNEQSFYPPDAKEKALARKKYGLGKNDVHIVYAGRWLATKGTCQLLRVLDLWPDKNVKVSLAGNFSPDFPLRMSGAVHFTFADYFKREFIARALDKQVRLFAAYAPDQLRELFWSADMFVYASGHEDENFGMAPREAALCGVPAVVTDFCGLHQIGAQMPWGCINTYPTFSGIRYSLKEFNGLLGKAAGKKDWDPQKCIAAVKKECSTDIARDNMRQAAESLLRQPLKKPLEPKAAKKKMMFDMIRYADENIARTLIEKKETPVDGAYVDGTGLDNEGFPYRKFLQAVQGFYTTFDKAPTVQPGDTLRGFFRVTAWPEEQAIVEVGFPGPRVKHYSDKDWRTLAACLQNDKPGYLVWRPRSLDQIRLAQELVDLGYLVPDDIT
jgi:glycosyltransferase involved in cell wall biosynthesis